MKVHALINQIANKFGTPYTEVISTPAFLLCKTVLIRFDTLKNNPIAVKKYFGFVIEDVLKGNKFFSVGDTITIRYSYPTQFEEGKYYLIPVTTQYSKANYNGEISIRYLREYYLPVMDGGIPAKTCPIENEIIKNVEYFGISDTNWTDFNKYFKEKYLIFD